MSDRVAVYIDFDNVFISGYDDVHGKQAWRKDDPRQYGWSAGWKAPVDLKLTAARVDIGAIIDFAASFGSVSLNRAYSDWSVPVSASYRTELIERSLHLVQVRNRHAIPSTVVRMSIGGLPRPFGEGNNGANTAHCLGRVLSRNRRCLLRGSRLLRC